MQSTMFSSTGSQYRWSESAKCRSFGLRAPSNRPSRASPKASIFPVFGKSQPLKKAVVELKDLLKDTARGVKSSPAQTKQILEVVERLKSGAQGTTTTGSNLSATWKLLWTTEKETLFILEKASFFGTQAGDVYQVIDVAQGSLQNVITFPPEGAFIVDSSISVADAQRTSFAFQSAKLKLPSRDVTLPPFGKGWFDTVYLDGSLRVSQDSRGDTLIVMRDGAPRRFT